jgi:prevent-host-death family protein
LDHLRYAAYSSNTTIQMNIAAAKAKLSELVVRAEAGEEVIIARDGKPVVTLTPKVQPRSAKRRIGVWDHLGSEIKDDLFVGPDADTAAAVEAWEAASIDPDR